MLPCTMLLSNVHIQKLKNKTIEMCSRRSNQTFNMSVPDISLLEIEFRNSLTVLYARLNERRASIEDLRVDYWFSSHSAVDEEALVI